MTLIGYHPGQVMALNHGSDILSLLLSLLVRRKSQVLPGVGIIKMTSGSSSTVSHISLNIQQEAAALCQADNPARTMSL